MPSNKVQVPLLKTKAGEAEQNALERARIRKAEREDRKGSETVPQNNTLTKARAIFDEHGSRDMETAFLEWVTTKLEESNENIK